MKRFLKYLSIILVTLVIAIFILLRQPAFQDRLLESAIENLAAPSSYLPEEDALTGVVCVQERLFQHQIELKHVF